MIDESAIPVLVVEDDEAHRDLVANHLAGTEPKFDVVYATSCAEAVAALTGRAFECVVLDHNLPDGTGAQLLEHAQYHLLTTPVVAFSTSADPDVAISELRGGCVEFLPKREAFKSGVLSRTIRAVIEKYRVRAAVERASSSVSLLERAGKVLDAAGVGPGAPNTLAAVHDKLHLIYETAVRTIQDGVVLVERRDRIVFANPAFKRLLGLSAVADLPRHPQTTAEDVFTPEALAAFRARPMERGQYETTLLGVDGRPVPVLIGENPVGEHGVLCAVSDLRTIKTQQAELERRNAKLAELYEAGNRFVDDVSHEFRTPLTVIKGYAELMAEGLSGPVSEQQRQFLGVVLDRTRDLAQMVDDLLDTSKLRAGCLRVDRRSHDVARIIDSLRPSIDQKAAANRITVRVETPDDLPHVHADAEKVGRVLLNLVVNAIKFSPEDSEVRLWARADEPGMVRLGVTDRGPGISEANLAVIFQRFKQVGDAPRSSTKGFGLGLSIARELVHLNLGDISVESAPGEGSTFSFTLPVDDPRVVIQRLLDRPPAQLPESARLAAIAVEPLDADSAERVRKFLASYTYPTDLVLEARTGAGFVLVGLTAHAERWAQRLGEAWTSVHADHAAALPPPLIRVLSTWAYPGQNTAAIKSLIARVAGAPS